MRAGLDPFLQRGDVFVAEFLLRRHPQVAVGVAHGLEQEAGVRLARLDGRSGVAAGHPALAGVEAEAALDLLSLAVALVAALDQQRPDALLKELVISGSGGEETWTGGDDEKAQQGAGHRQGTGGKSTVFRWPHSAPAR